MNKIDRSQRKIAGGRKQKRTAKQNNVRSRTLTGHERSFPKSYGHDIKSVLSRIQFSIDLYRQNMVLYGQNNELEEFKT